MARQIRQIAPSGSQSASGRMEGLMPLEFRDFDGVGGKAGVIPFEW